MKERHEVAEDAAGLRGLARLLLVAEDEGAADPSPIAGALDRVCSKLHHQLARVVGDLGVRLMVRRAVMLTLAEFPFIIADPLPGDDEYLQGLR